MVAFFVCDYKRVLITKRKIEYLPLKFLGVRRVQMKTCHDIIQRQPLNCQIRDNVRIMQKINNDISYLTLLDYNFLGSHSYCVAWSCSRYRRQSLDS